MSETIMSETIMNREELKKILLHREPMLLVDEAFVDEENVAHATYHVRGDEFFLQGHFPGNPVVPGVILCEIMAQSCGIILGRTLAGKAAYYTGIDKMRFKQKALPGDTLDITARITKNKGVFYFASSEIYIDGNLAARGELSFAVPEKG